MYTVAVRKFNGDFYAKNFATLALARLAAIEAMNDVNVQEVRIVRI